jgi:hypothetical protein
VGERGGRVFGCGRLCRSFDSLRSLRMTDFIYCVIFICYAIFESGEVGDEDLAGTEEEEGVAVGGEERCAAFAEVDGVAAGGGLEDDFDGRGALEVGGVCGLAAVTGFGTVDVGDGGRVGRPGESGDVLAIVRVVVGELAGGLLRAGDPDIADAFGVSDC